MSCDGCRRQDDDAFSRACRNEPTKAPDRRKALASLSGEQSLAEAFATNEKARERP